MINPLAAQAQAVEEYRKHVKNKYKDMEQAERIEAMLVDIFALLYVSGIVMRDKE